MQISTVSAIALLGKHRSHLEQGYGTALADLAPSILAG